MRGLQKVVEAEAGEDLQGLEVAGLVELHYCYLHPQKKNEKNERFIFFAIFTFA
jgi:hypothetical protein